MKTKKLLLILIALLSATLIYSQTFEEYKKQKESELEVFEKRQQEFIDRMQNEFDEYVKQKDQEFAEYLKTHWEQFEVFKGVDPPERPKPPVIEPYEPEPDREGQFNRTPIIKPKINLKKEITSEIKTPLIQKSEEEIYDKSNTTFGFFGFRIILDYDQKLKFDPPKLINPTTISGIWDKMSQANHTGLINQLEEYKSTLNLNDWAYYLMLHEFAKTIYPDSKNGEDLLVWGLMTRSGFKTRIAYANNNLSLLVPSYHTIYSKSFLKADGLNYYLMNNIGSENIFTYDKDYPDANKIFDFSISSPLNFSKNVKQKNFNFTFNEQPYSFNFLVNQNLIDFYKDYPQVDLNTYFDAAVSQETRESIFESFKPVINEMSETEAVSFLLRFVQTSFNYKTDQQQFFKEKFFFPEEIFFYPYSDCEDRSVLFAYLVKSLLNKEVIGIEYPGHITTAVKFDTQVEGDYIMFNDEKYVIADPTFVNAPIGMSMPEYRGKEGTIIEIDNYFYNSNNNKSFWELVRQSGGNRGSNLQDIIFDEEGNAFLTGYYVGDMKLGNFLLKSNSEDQIRNIFVIKYSKDGDILWARNAIGNKSATGFSIIDNVDKDIFVAGSFSGNIVFANGAVALNCQEGFTDIFLARYSSDGQFKWAVKAGLDTYPQENHLTYLTQFTKDGVNKGTTFYSENENFRNYGLQIGPMGLLYLTGAFQSTTGFNAETLALTTNELENLELAQSLKAENDKLVSENCDQNIAGLFAMLNHVKYTGFRISGEDVQMAIDLNNPEFKNEYSELYNSIGKIILVLNNDGIVMVETQNGKSIFIKEMKIKDGSQLKLTSFESGDAQIDILSGVSVGKIFIWFDLNFVKMYRNNGNMLFDFASDHLQKMMNFKEDILR